MLRLHRAGFRAARGGVIARPMSTEDMAEWTKRATKELKGKSPQSFPTAEGIPLKPLYVAEVAKNDAIIVCARGRRAYACPFLFVQDAIGLDRSPPGVFPFGESLM